MEIDYLSIEKVTLAGIISANLRIQAKDHKRNVLKWSNFLVSDEKGNFVPALEIKNALDKKVESAETQKERSFHDSMQGRYIANRDFQQWRDSLPHGANRFFEEVKKRLVKRNEDFILQEEERLREFFDTVESRQLTEEQRRAAIVMEDNNLLVAAAGSGKTSAIVGKVGYLLKKGYCNPSEILLLAFNRKAAREMEERIKQRLGRAAEGVVVKTFHKCGLDIIARAEQVRPSVADWTANMGESSGANKKWEEMISSIARKDRKFSENLAELFAYFRWAIKPMHLFRSKSEYEQHMRALRAKKNSGRDNDNWGAPTMNGEYVRSLEEAAIANWLYVNNVEYKHEMPYRHATADEQHRQYRPDFYYPQISVYHEHFALDESGKAPSFFPGYEEGVQWKRELHSRYDTKLIETRSAMFKQKDIFEHLREQLQEHGMRFRKQRMFGEITEKLQEQFVRPLYRTMLTFLTHWKSSGMSESQLIRDVGDLPWYEKVRTNLFVRIMVRIRKEYDAILHANNEIDFEDMLCKAEEHLRNGRWRHPYKIILVDEFQDVSRSRARLIKAMMNQAPDCKMFAVGDDWQSIYRFAGADISVMTNYAGIFGVTATNYLRTAFRSNQGIVDIATAFISRNPSQLSKEVKAQDTAVSRVVCVTNYLHDKDVVSFIGRQLLEISANKQRVKVYILARYKKFLDLESIRKWRRQFGNVLDIEFSTIHSVKGREADYVFVLGMDVGEYGFPSEIEDDPVLQVVMPESEKFLHAEERRLFYVALTRARRKVFLLTRKQDRSPFVNEILANNQGSIYECDVVEGGKLEKSIGLPACPECGGPLAKRQSRFGSFLGCSNYPKCRHTQPIPVAPE